METQIARITHAVLTHVQMNHLPEPDFHGAPDLAGTIRSLLEREKLTDSECFSFCICMEEIDPTLEEEVALQRMGAIIQGARVRRGCPPDRMNDAVSV